MSKPYALCICGAEFTTETATQRHALTCPLLGRPWTNPDYPKPQDAA